MNENDITSFKGVRQPGINPPGMSRKNVLAVLGSIAIWTALFLAYAFIALV